MNEIQLRQLLPTDPAEQNLVQTIAGNLLLSGKDTSIIAVTSCRDGEGKSTVTLQLAHALANEGHTVVVVDAALCSTSLLSYPARETERDLETYRRGDCALTDIVYPTDVSNLYILPRTMFTGSGAIPGGTAPTIPQTVFSTLLEGLAQSYDFIFVDTPSAGKSIEATKLASLCDGIILVVQYKKTKKKDIAEVVRQLARAGKPILGCVINQVRFDSILTRKRYRLLRTPFKRIFR